VKVSILHYSNSIIDLNKIFGMQRMELSEIRELQKKDINATLYAKDVIGNHPHVHKLTYFEYEKDLYDLPYFTRFVDKNSDADILQGNATPLLCVFHPEKTILRFDGPVDFPLKTNPSVLKAYKKTNYVFVSRYLKEFFLTQYPFIPENHCHILHNAVDLPLEPSPKNNKKAKLLFCSRWVRDKGIFVLLEALKILEKSRDDYEVIIAGGIHTTSKASTNIAYEKEIISKIEQRHNTRSIGYIPHEKLRALFNEINILLFPSLWDEPFGLIPAEAAMSSVPTIAFEVGALPEVVKHKQTGFLIKKSRFDYISARRLANTIKKVLDHPNFVEGLGENAKKRCMEKFDWPKYTKNLLNIYHKVTGITFER